MKTLKIFTTCLEQKTEENFYSLLKTIIVQSNYILTFNINFTPNIEIDVTVRYTNFNISFH